MTRLESERATWFWIGAAAGAVAMFIACISPAKAACLMGLEGADRTIAQHHLVKHVLTGQRLLAFVDINRERAPEYKLEDDTTALWLLEAPQHNVGFIIEINEEQKCVTFRPEQAPLEALKQILVEISRRVVGA